MGLVEFVKKKGDEPKCAAQGDRIVFTEAWPEEVVRALQRMNISENDEDLGNLYSILSMMEIAMMEGEFLVPIAYDRNFSLNGRKIEAVKRHFQIMMMDLEARAEQFRRISGSRLYDEIYRMLSVLKNNSEED